MLIIPWKHASHKMLQGLFYKHPCTISCMKMQQCKQNSENQKREDRDKVISWYLILFQFSQFIVCQGKFRLFLKHNLFQSWLNKIKSHLWEQSLLRFFQSMEIDFVDLENNRGGGVLPYLGYTVTSPSTRYGFFGLAVLNRVYNLTCLCPKQV